MQKGVQLIQKWHCPELFCVLNGGYTQHCLYPAAAVSPSACQSTVRVTVLVLEEPQKRAWLIQASRNHLELQNSPPVNRSPRQSYFAGAQRQPVIPSTYKSWKTSNCISSQPQISCISLDCFVLLCILISEGWAGAETPHHSIQLF